MEKTSKLIFDAKIARKLLKNNGEFKYCPCCGKPLTEGCECNKNIIIDIKKKRDSENETIFIFDNNEQFVQNYNKIIEEIKENSTK